MLTEGKHTGEFLLSEANGTRSRDEIVIASGSGKLVPGTVLGKVTATGKYVPYDDDFTTGDPAAPDGREVAKAILYAGVDATSADVAAVGIVRDAEVSGSELTWHSNNDSGDKTAGIADLAALGIIVR